METLVKLWLYYNVYCVIAQIILAVLLFMAYILFILWTIKNDFEKITLGDETYLFRSVSAPAARTITLYKKRLIGVKRVAQPFVVGTLYGPRETIHSAYKNNRIKWIK